MRASIGETEHKCDWVCELSRGIIHGHDMHPTMDSATDIITDVLEKSKQPTKCFEW